MNAESGSTGWLRKMKIVEATVHDMPTVHGLFREYQQWVGVDLCFQGFEKELETLPGSYAAPNGVLLLALDGGKAVGCVGVRPRVEDEAELKRLYVRSSHQCRGIGRELLQVAMWKAAAMGYRAIVLDTLPTMRAGKSLYANYGFKEIPAYYENPEEGVQYFRLAFR